MQNGETRMACETERTFQKQQRRELWGYCRILQFPITFPAGRLTAEYQVTWLLLTDRLIRRVLTSNSTAFPQGNIDPLKALSSHIQHLNVATPTPI
eukprot:574417-Pleurochrysis_carterae.AAC.2